ncbi:iron ABC transporter permease [Paenibacillus alba]|uniref:FecCD family ABC transporter permease n=1 Tax=Paenibacillus alba TaxID=1197127 RepID=UPI0015671C74|nr:iron ABC transporter permease [Paenibacillus alba]NQX69123.1 iron ABC transporter permease [Paenibacillus alba]
MILRSNSARITGLVVGLGIAAALFLSSNVYGYTDTSWSTFLAAYLRFDGTNAHVVIRDIRLPRALIACIVGGALATAGTLMQALTRNPMASPGVLGINAGAGFFIVIGFSVLSMTSQLEFMWLSLLGAAVAAVGVYFIAAVGHEGITPLKLTLAGVTLSALFTSFTAAILVSNDSVLDNIFLWMAGSVEGRKLEAILPVLPFFLAGAICALFLGQAMNVISVGEDVAKGLGQNTLRVKIVALIVIVLLAGSSVAIAGPIGFVGLIIPHVVRGIVGIDHRWVIPYSIVSGASLLLAADIAARFVAYPKEVPVGVMTAIIGAPFFIYLARKEYVAK